MGYIISLYNPSSFTFASKKPYKRQYLHMHTWGLCYGYNISIAISDFKKNQINEFGPTAPNLWFDCAKMFLKQVIIYYIFSQYLSVFIEIVLYLHSNSIVNDFGLKQKENVIASIFWCNSQTWTNGHYLRRPFYLSFYLSLIIWSSSLSTSSMFSARKKCRILNTLLCWRYVYF